MTAPEFLPPRADPYEPPPLLTSLRESTPITRVRIWDGSTPWLVTRYADVRAVLADPRFSADPARPGYPSRGPASTARRRTDSATGARAGSFITMDPPRHTHYRRMLISEFTVRRMAALRPAIEHTAAELLDALAVGPRPADLVAGYALPLPSITISVLLGVPYDDHAFFEDRARAMVDNHAGAEQNRRASAELARYLATLIDTRRDTPTDDLLGRLVADQVAPGHITRSEAVSMAILLLVAGHETTSNMITLATAFLLDNPDIAAAFHAAGPSPAAVDELLRLLTITHTGRRRVATEDLTLADTAIHAGDGIVAAADIANRDPRQFPHPERADFARTPNHHLAFGHGAHLCLGHHLARLELQVALHALFHRLPTLQLAAPREDLPFRHDQPIYGIDRLPVTWHSTSHEPGDLFRDRCFR